MSYYHRFLVIVYFIDRNDNYFIYKHVYASTMRYYFVM